MEFPYFLVFCACVFLVESQQEKCKSRAGKSGTCIDLYACNSVMSILHSKKDFLQWPIIIREYNCGLKGNKQRVCCPNSKTDEDSEDPPDVANHPNLKLLPYGCGSSDTQNRIINGNKTHIYDFPWMARLLYQSPDGPKFGCGATVLNQNYLLTAAHCIKHTRNQLIGARVGDHDFSKEKDCELDEENVEICLPPPQNLTIEEMIPHPEYDQKKGKNDIALLRVSPMDLSKRAVSAICMPLEKTRTYNLTNKYGLICGWGDTETRDPSPVLLKVSLPIISSVACNDIYANFATIDSSQLCAGGKGRSDSCFGDSGGPLQYVHNLNNDVRFVQHGIISFARYDTCGRGHPDVYTRVAYFMKWILDAIRP